MSDRNRRFALRDMAAGFTLIELMITVAVIAILAAIALPNYQDYVIKSRRNTAQACLTEGAQFLERYYTTNLTYVGASLPACSAASDSSGFASHYTLALTGSAATTFTVTATPLGGQASKEKVCGTMTINQAGSKTQSITGTPCWTF